MTQTSPTIFTLETIDSTNNEAKRLIEKGYTHLVVTADAQTAGKGQQGRQWQSNLGGLYYSYATTTPSFNHQDIDTVTLDVGNRLINLIRSLTNIPVELEWPNDIILGFKKCGGILIECNSSASKVSPNYAIIGIGLNLNQTEFKPPISHTATSLRQYRNETIDSKAFIKAITEEIRNACERN
jgi:BirA family transcriptional regulator, biotin operon repressor / biotin---[acetyl-CoA-carboxylase] ligase